MKKQKPIESGPHSKMSSRERIELSMQRKGINKKGLRDPNSVCFLTQRELLELFKKFKKAFWGVTLSEHDWLPAKQWGEDRALYRTICFCLYQLIEHKGVYTPLYEEVFIKCFADAMASNGESSEAAHRVDERVLDSIKDKIPIHIPAPDGEE